jgi:hypothetical protein
MATEQDKVLLLRDASDGGIRDDWAKRGDCKSRFCDGRASRVGH